MCLKKKHIIEKPIYFLLSSESKSQNIMSIVHNLIVRHYVVMMTYNIKLNYINHCLQL